MTLRHPTEVTQQVINKLASSNHGRRPSLGLLFGITVLRSWDDCSSPIIAISGHYAEVLCLEDCSLHVVRLPCRLESWEALAISQLIQQLAPIPL